MAVHTVLAAMERSEVDVLEIRLGGLKSVARRLITQDMDGREPGGEPRRESWYRVLVSRDLASADYLAPDPALEPRDERAGFSVEQHSALRQDGHPAAELAHILDDVRREDHHRGLPDLAQQIVEAEPLLRIEAGGRLVDDDQLRIAKECLRDPEAPAHAAREAAELTQPNVVEVGHSQKPCDDFTPLAGGNESLQHGEVVQQRLGRDSRVDAHLLRQVAQDLAHLGFLVEHIESFANLAPSSARRVSRGVEIDAPRVDALQRGDGPHQRRLP